MSVANAPSKSPPRFVPTLTEVVEFPPLLGDEAYHLHAPTGEQPLDASAAMDTPLERETLPSDAEVLMPPAAPQSTSDFLDLLNAVAQKNDARSAERAPKAARTSFFWKRKKASAVVSARPAVLHEASEVPKVDPVDHPPIADHQEATAPVAAAAPQRSISFAGNAWVQGGTTVNGVSHAHWLPAWSAPSHASAAQSATLAAHGQVEDVSPALTVQQPDRLDPETIKQLENRLIHSVMQRVEAVLEQRLGDALVAVVREQTQAILPQLLKEVESVVSQTVAQAVADELVAIREIPV